MKIVIFANGELENHEFYVQNAENADFIICCDGGSAHAAKLNIVPNVILGDMDSVDPAITHKFKGWGVIFEKFPAQKDATDLELAISFAMQKQPDQIVVLAGFGGRPDHFIGNIHALVPAAKSSIKAFLLGPNAKASIIHGYASIAREHYDHISLIPLTTEARGVTTRGLAYPLQNETLHIGTTRGISNAFTEDAATISVNADGLLLAICTRGA